MNIFKRFLGGFVLAVLMIESAPFLTPAIALAQTDPCNGSVTGKTDAQLRADLAACEAEAARLQEILNNTKQTTANYASEVAKLTAKINAAQATIRAKNVAIAGLTSNISKKESQITNLEGKIEADIEHIAELVRKTKQIDSFSLAEAVLSDKDISTFFSDVSMYASTRTSLIAVVDELRGTKKLTEAEKAALAKQRDAESAARAQIEASKKQVEETKKIQNTLLTQSQDQERAYAQLVAEKQAKAAAIRTALFGLRDAVSIPFSVALEYAEAASAKTGVRPALILGILQQESNLGANVGSCVITDLASGQTKNVNTGKIYANGIHPTRDLPLLQSLLPSVGRDPLVTKVSCPLSIGYGGAMGPAQFIPSTWNIMKGKIATATGKVTPDPWNPADAIMAMALYLKDLGASTGVYINERTAACRYYSGQNCYTSSGKAGVGLGYGTSVMSKATAIQANIDLLKEV